MRAYITADNCKKGICAEFVTAYRAGKPPVTIDWDSSECIVDDDGHYQGKHRGVQADELYINGHLDAVAGFDRYVVEFQSYVGEEHDIGKPANVSVIFDDDGNTLALPMQKVKAENWEEEKKL